MAKWIKNASSTLSTYCGQDIAVGAYYEIQSHQEDRWANDSTLLTDIGSGDAVVAKDDSGTTDFTDVNEGINHLKNLLPQSVSVTGPIQNSGVKDPKGMRARLIGIINGTVTAGQTKDLDWLCPQLQYQSTNKNSYFDGIQYYAKDATIGDHATFQVVDKGAPGAGSFGINAGWYDQATFDAMGNVYVVEEFGFEWLMIPNTMEDLMLYKAVIIPGLYIRMKYKSVGANDVKIIVNLFRHLDGDS